MKKATASSRRRVGVACAAATAVSLAVGADAQWGFWVGGGGGYDGVGDSNQNSPPSGDWNEPARQGYTRPEELANLIIFRDAMRERGLFWHEATDNWTCGNETDPYQLASCNPCGNEAWGYWKHVGCRGDPIAATPWLFYSPGDGWVTDFHITDYKVTGSVGVDLDRRAPRPDAQTRRSRSRSRSLAPRASSLALQVPLEYMCPFSHLRQFDMDGGWMTGQIPSEFAQCYPDLLELDLSFNNLTGVIPPEIGKLSKLHEFKIESQARDDTTMEQGVGGPIPESIGGMTSLRWMRLHDNRLNGTIPESMSNTARFLQQMTMDENELEGNLYALKDHQFANIGVNNNARLCGMVPLGVRYAHGFNYHGTNLGVPCPDEDVGVLQG